MEVAFNLFDFQNIFESLRKAVVPCYHKNKEYKKYISWINFMEFLDSPKLFYWSELKTPFLFDTPTMEKKLD